MTELSLPNYRFKIDSFTTEASNTVLVARIVMNLSENSAEEFLRTHKDNNLSIGLKFYTSHSHSSVYLEKRSNKIEEYKAENRIYCQFLIHQEDFKERMAVLAKIDLVYEGRYWLEDIGNPVSFVTIINDLKPPEKVDVFDYYKSKLLGVEA